MYLFYFFLEVHSGRMFYVEGDDSVLVPLDKVVKIKLFTAFPFNVLISSGMGLIKLTEEPGTAMYI